MLNENEYATVKHVVMEYMQQMDLNVPDMSTFSSSTTLSSKVSTLSSNRKLAFKSSIMNIANKKPPQPLSFQPLIVDLEIAAFSI